MVSRGELRDAVYSEMTAVAGTYDVTDADGNVVDTVTLDADAIGLRHPEEQEPDTSIVYHETYRPLVFNGVGAGPDYTYYNADGTVDREAWREYMEAQFIVDVRASSESAKEPIYESLRTQFGKYQFDPWPETDIHQHVFEVSVEDSTTVDTGDAESVIRGDQLEIYVSFYREYELDAALINKVSISVDADTDPGTVGINYTHS